MTQYALNIALPPVFAAGTFVVSGYNREAWRWVESWPRWPSPSLLVQGASGCGKTHLGHVWAEKAQAAVIGAAALAGGEAGKGNLLIEDIERAKEERPLLHCINYARENGASLLLTSSLAPAELPFALPDLTSRLLALPLARIGRPDDDALAAVMRKQFADRQMKVDEGVIAYLLPRMERSPAAAKALVERLDARALAEGRGVTVSLVRRVLET